MAAAMQVREVDGFRYSPYNDRWEKPDGTLPTWEEGQALSEKWAAARRQSDLDQLNNLLGLLESMSPSWRGQCIALINRRYA